MAVKIRLKRMGAKKKPFYRIVAADSRNKRDGKFIENLGTYDVTKEPAIITVKTDRVLYWLSTGAIPTDTVRSILSKQGIMKKFAEDKNQNKKPKTTKKATSKTTTSTTTKKNAKPKKDE